MPLIMSLFGQQDPLGNEGHKKAFTLIKLLWMFSLIASQFPITFGRTDAQYSWKTL